MEEAKKVSELIGGIYDAALEHDQWPTMLRQIADFVGGHSATIFAKEVAKQEGFVAYESGEISDRYKKSYFEKYVKLDPATTGHFFAQVDEPISTEDLVPYDEFVQSQFYLEWAKPQGLIDFVASVLDKSLTSGAMFGVFRHERDGLVDEGVRRRMRLIVPHIRRSVLIGRVIDLKTSEAKAYSGIFDHLATAMCLVDGASRIVHANAAGLALLSAGDTLRSVSGKLEAVDRAINAQLGTIFSDASDGDLAIGTKGIAIPMVDRASAHLVAHVLPLNAGLRGKEGRAFQATAAIFVKPAQTEAQAPPEIIAKTFKLTPTELRIMLAIVEVGGVPEVAVALGIAESTVKTHLSRLYEKTGAKRHADLVKIFANFATPLFKK
jgi:DNA-binding CsgD family transcriptional regulator